MNEEDKGLVPSATILRIDEQARRLPPVLGEFAVQERAQLLERIESQAREIERLREALEAIVDNSEDRSAVDYAKGALSRSKGTP